jgi:TolB-like protein
MPERTEFASSRDPAEVKAGSVRDVFISYASHDAEVAQRVCSALEAAHFACWMAPRDVKAGAQYADAIVRAINEARAIVLVLSASAVASSHVGREVERAVSKHKVIIAFRLDAAALSPALEYFLGESQWIDVPALGMPAALAKLTEALGQESATPAHAVAVGKRPVSSAGEKKRLIVAAAAVLGVAGVVALGLHFWRSPRDARQAPAVSALNGSQANSAPGVPISDKSIAVLPFADMSEKKDQEYFADGMAEEIIDLLVNIPGLKVIGRTSSFQFKGHAYDLRRIGTQLGVAYVLEGSVRKSGDRLRVTTQLIDSKDGSQIFSQTYEQNVTDVLKMQDAIATTLVRALQIEVSADGLVARPALRNTEAYTQYLQGLHAFDRNDQQGFEQAASNFQRALDLDPSFAAAAAGLGSAYFVLGQFGFMPPAIAFGQARDAAQHALKLDPKLARGHAELGEVYRAYDWNWAAAEREVTIARGLAPNDGDVLFISAVQAQNMGNWDEALKYVKASLAQDPLNPGAYMVLNLVQLRRGRLEEAEAAARRTLEISPTFIPGHFFLGRVLLARGQPQAALAEMLKETDDGSRFGGSAMAYFALKRGSDSDVALKHLLEQGDSPFFIAQVYAFRGQLDEAVNWLERGYTQKDPGILLLKSQLPSKLESDPRYKAFLRKLKLPE